MSDHFRVTAEAQYVELPVGLDARLRRDGDATQPAERIDIDRSSTVHRNHREEAYLSRRPANAPESCNGYNLA